MCVCLCLCLCLSLSPSLSLPLFLSLSVRVSLSRPPLPPPVHAQRTCSFLSFTARVSLIGGARTARATAAYAAAVVSDAKGVAGGIVSAALSWL